MPKVGLDPGYYNIGSRDHCLYTQRVWIRGITEFLLYLGESIV